MFSIACGNYQAPASAAKTADPAYDGRKDSGIRFEPHRGPWRRIFTIDLNRDQIPDTITISSSTGDPKTYDTVSIVLAHFGRTTFTSTNVWSTVDKEFLDSNANAVSTDLFFLRKNQIQSVLLLFGEEYESGRDEFGIIDIEDNQPKMVLRQELRHIDIDLPISLTDLNGDGRLDLLYRQAFQFNGQPPDSLGGMVGTYSPYFIYTIDDKCVLNKDLMRRYNDSLYVFAGYSYDERIDVYYPKGGGKPHLVHNK